MVKASNIALDLSLFCMAFQPYFALHFARMLLPYIEPLTLISWAAVFVQLFLVIGVTLRVMLTRHPPGSSFAWILITAILPYFGFILYLLMGERTLGKWHARKLRREMRKRRQIFRHFMHTDAMAPLQWRGLSRLATRLSRCPLTQQSSLALLSDADETLTRLVKDIDNARSCIVMEFYIWDVGGKADDVSSALIRAARRGVKCYVLVDAIGSSKFLSSHWAPMFRHEGIRLESALPVSIFSALLSRVDIRLHRKVVVIDQSIGYSGSLNMADPHFFKKKAKVGQWIDAMVRTKGEIVASLYYLISFDWKTLSVADDELPEFKAKNPPKFDIPDQAAVMLVPSGPATNDDANQRIILDAIYNARQEVRIVTPYFVPGEALALALQNAAVRGVKVLLIVAEKSDSRPVDYASRRYFEDLLRAGVKIFLHKKGMLHTKSIIIDGEVSLFGTVNMDMRSMHLNYELMLLVFDREFNRKIAMLNNQYEADSEQIALAKWYKRPIIERMKEGACYLISPLL